MKEEENTNDYDIIAKRRVIENVHFVTIIKE